jgi:uncharacterized hydrophobic protein (TIGR00271 family)
MKHWLQKQAFSIDHNGIIKDVYREVDMTAGYFIILTLANLIALNGLIQNSSPVIIGAMLISPLMGPILSFGFAFITGDRFIWRKSIIKITLSIILIIGAAAVTTYLSPLKDITNEIISRTRPNLYDLIIAFLSGIAGAMAICTKKNYLTIVPGVAIATAVIPPLSVAGFGLGIWSWRISAGGFLLFFTNCVAIIIATCIIFYFYGFRTAITTEGDVSELKKRGAFLFFVLFIISIPLIYTLHTTIAEVRLRTQIQSTLKKAFDRGRSSSLSTFNYVKKENGKLEINAVVNTVDYLKEAEINRIEEGIKDDLDHDVTLYIEQVKVQPGGLKEATLKPLLPVIAPPAPPKRPSEILKSSRDSVTEVVRRSTEKINHMIAPSTISDFSVGFHDKATTVSITMNIKRDRTFSEEEIIWLKRLLSTDLNMPVDLSVETSPFVPLLVFGEGETVMSDGMKKALEAIRDVYAKHKNVKILIESSAESSFPYRERIRLAEQRAAAVISLLTKEFQIPESSITSAIEKKAVKTPTVKVSIVS